MVFSLKLFILKKTAISIILFKFLFFCSFTGFSLKKFPLMLLLKSGKPVFPFTRYIYIIRLCAWHGELMIVKMMNYIYFCVLLFAVYACGEEQLYKEIDSGV